MQNETGCIYKTIRFRRIVSGGGRSRLYVHHKYFRMKIDLPENIRLTNPERYILTIGIGSGRFSFFLYNPVEDGSFFYFPGEKFEKEEAFSQFKECFYENDFFGLPFRKIYLMNYSRSYTYVPSLIYEKDSKNDFRDFLFSEKESNRKIILEQPLAISQLVILHSLEEALYDFFQRSFIQPKFVHYSSPFISYFQTRSKINPRHQLIVNFTAEGIDLFCFRQGNFILGNHFACPQSEDAIYYILFTWKQLQLDQMKDFIYISGNTETKKQAIEKLKTYIHNIIPVNITPEAHFEGIRTNNVPFEILASTLCEL